MNPGADFIQAPSGSRQVSLGNLSTNGGVSTTDAGSELVNGEKSQLGLLILNADDWGRDRQNTERILECLLRRTVSSASGMVFMEDSERAAAIARERGIDVGLHINFTTPFSAKNCPTRLADYHNEVAAYLLRRRFARIVFHPWLARSFEYVVKAQLEEYHRLYGAEPERLDGHHHMHLCANVVFGGLLPRWTLVRRNFSFTRGQKSLSNRLYRRFVDGILERRHCLVDFFFSIAPIELPGRLQQIFSLARRHVVEVMTHPVDPKEYEFLAGGEILHWTEDVAIAPRFAVLRSRCPGKGGHS
jgi:chitin disaccharide deacetylase